MDTELSVEELYQQAAKGDTSDTLLRFLGDWFEKRKEQAGRKVCNCEPTLEKLLEARSELKEIMRMEQRLLRDIAEGKVAKEDVVKLKGGK